MEDLSTYNPEGSELRKMQLRMLEILSYVDIVCEKHGIKYWLTFGTLLGAVRHNGFIPWDDDLDIEMLKPDFNKLIEIIKNDPHPKYELQTHETDPNYVQAFAKLRDKFSVVTENKNADKNYKFRGIFIDLFYIESGNKFLSRLTVNLQKFVYVLTLLKNDKLGIVVLVRNIMHFIVHKLSFPLIRLFVKISGIKTFIPPFGTGFSSQRDISDIFPLKRISFEGFFFNSPNNTDSYLKKIYGDYMTVPEKSKRIVHTINTIVIE